MARKNKSKKEVVVDIKTAQNVERMRKVVREVLYPFMLELNDTIGFTKIFLQTAATGLDNVFNETQRTVKVGDLMPHLKEVFTGNDMDKYIRLFELLKDETVFDFTTVISSMPRVIEQYFTKEMDKNPVLDIPIDKVLG